jgi:hypothetical protein
MIKSKILNAAPKQWKSWILANFDLVEELRLETVGVCIKNDKLTLVYNPEFIDSLTQKDLSLLIKHEVAHIIRGDVLVTGVDRRIANIAMDAIINEVLGIEKIGNVKGIRLSNLISQYPELENCTGWREIYDFLINQESPASSASSIDELLENGDNAKNPHQIVSDAIADLVLSDPDILKEVKLKSNPKRDIKIEYRHSPLLESIIREVEGNSGIRTRRKSYRRENPVSPLLRGITKLNSQRILLVADVSGSYKSYLTSIMSLIYWLNHKGFVSKMGVFANEFALVDNAKNIPNVGHCTYIEGMFEHLKSNSYDLVIVFTDGDIYDYNEGLRNKYSGRILWVLDDEENKEKFSRDKVLLNSQVGLKK